MKSFLFSILLTTAAVFHAAAQSLVGTTLIPVEPYPLTLSVEAADSSSRGPLSGKFIRFGTSELDAAPVERTLLLRNHFPLPLVHPQLVIEGPHAADFSAETGDLIPVDGTLPLTLRFQAGATGPRHARLKIIIGQFVYQELELGGTGAYGAAASIRPVGYADWVGTALLDLPDGSILVAGYERSYPTTTSQVRRISQSGQNLSFIGHGANGPIRALAHCPDGTYLVAGEFTSIGGQPKQGIARLTVHGDVHVNFNPPAGNFSARAMVSLQDGKVLVGGSGQLGGRSGLIRLNSDGSLDTSFTLPEPDGHVNALALQPDGKVLVGGEFTNLASNSPSVIWNSSPTLDLLQFTVYPAWGPRSSSLQTGLVRLDTAGTIDQTFYNLGFDRVTAIAVRGKDIAVAGQQQWMSSQWFFREWLAITNVYRPGGSTDVWSPPPNYWFRSKVALLAESGWEMRTRMVDNEPTAIAIGPGRRVHYAPGDGTTGDARWWSSATVSHMDFLGDDELFGLRMLPLSESPSYDGHRYTVGTRYQHLDGPVQALLAQEDGKVLATGDFNTASIVQHDITAGVPAQLLRLENLTSGPLPAPQTVPGLVQLDTDGFVKPSLPITVDGGDGFAQLDLCYQCAYIWYPPWHGFSGPASATYTWTIDGPDAASFSVAASSGPQHWAPGSIIYPVGTPQPPPPSYFEVRVNPSRAGKLKAKLHIKMSGSDEVFDIGLHSQVESGLHIEASAEGRTWRDSGETIDLGTLPTGDDKTLTVNLRNPFSFFDTELFSLEVQGTGFGTAQTGVHRLLASQTLPVAITLTPEQTGAYQGKLILTPQTGSLPFVIHLKGFAAAPPAPAAAETYQLAPAGEPLTLTAPSQSALRTQKQWYRDGTPIRYGVLDALTIPQPTLADAGRYECRITNALGSSSTFIEVGVINVQNSTLYGQTGKQVEMRAQAAGSPLTYTWTKNGKVVKKATTHRLSIPKFTAAAAGTYECEVRLGTARLTAATYQVRRLVPPTIAPTPGLTGQVGEPVSLTLTAGPGPCTWRSTSLPAGLFIHSSTGVISGVPRLAGSFSVRVTAINSAGQTTTTLPTHIAPLPATLLGTFEGLLPRAAAFTRGKGGHLTLLISSTGAFTGRLSSSQTWPLIGSMTRVGSQMTATCTHAATGTTLHLSHSLDTPAPPHIQVSITTDDEVETLHLVRRSTQAAPSLLEAQLQPTSASPADISGTVTLQTARNGSALFSGQLTWPSHPTQRLLAPIHLLEDGRLLYYRLMLAPTGSSLQGSLQIENGTLTGTGDWGSATLLAPFEIVP